MLKELGKGIGRKGLLERSIHILYITELEELAEYHGFSEDDEGFAGLVGIKYDEMLEDLEQRDFVVVELEEDDKGKIFFDEHTLVDSVIKYLEKEIGPVV